MTATDTAAKEQAAESAFPENEAVVAVAADVAVSRKAVRSRGEIVRRGILLALPPLAVFALIIVVWYITHFALGTRNFLMPSPDQVLTQGFLDPQAGPAIISAVLLTTIEAITGLAIAAALGISWAVGMSLARWFQRSTYPYAVILQCIPILALVPLIAVYFGYDFTARVVVCVMIALFPIVANTLFGLQSVDRSQHELFKLQKASRWTVLTKLLFPAALPSVFVGLRTSAGLAVVGAIVGDFYFQRGQPGVGSLLLVYARLLEYSQLFATVISAALLGVAMFAIFGLVSRLVVGKWYDPVK